ncbi:MAG: hypothetical protein MIO92_02260 [Methanosarcinaceae archaeon]|jgi:hypothetical protein|nr:hypothetical protein [Methanosarcinaceae archaeon]
MNAELIVDGEKVPMNEFVQKILGSIVGGVVETLHGVESEWTEVSLKIKR